MLLTHKKKSNVLFFYDSNIYEYVSSKKTILKLMLIFYFSKRTLKFYEKTNLIEMRMIRAQMRLTSETPYPMRAKNLIIRICG